MLCQGNKKSPLCALAQIHTHTHTRAYRVYMAHNGCLPGRHIHCANPCKSIYPKMLSLRTSSRSERRFAVWLRFALGSSSCWVCLGVRVLGGADGWLACRLVGWLHWRQQPLRSSSSAASSCVVGIKNAINTRTQCTQAEHRDKQQRSGNFMPFSMCLCRLVSVHVCVCVHLPYSFQRFHISSIRTALPASSTNVGFDVGSFSIFRSGLAHFVCHLISFVVLSFLLLLLLLCVRLCPQLFIYYAWRCVGVAPRCVCVMPEKRSSYVANWVSVKHIGNVNMTCNQALGEHISFSLAFPLWLIGKY